MGHRHSFCFLHLKTLAHAAGAGIQPPDLPFSGHLVHSEPVPVAIIPLKKLTRAPFVGPGPFTWTSYFRKKFQACRMLLIFKIKSKFLK